MPQPDYQGFRGPPWNLPPGTFYYHPSGGNLNPLTPEQVQQASQPASPYLRPRENFSPISGNIPYYLAAMQNAVGGIQAIGNELGPSGGIPYTTPPAGGRLMDTLGALQGMGGALPSQTFSDRRSLGLIGPQLGGIGAQGRLGLTLQEPGRINQLLATLLQGYGLTGAIQGEQQAAQAAAREIQIRRRQQLSQIISGVPIVGQILGAAGVGG